MRLSNRADLPSEEIGTTAFRALIDRAAERLRAAMPQWRRLTRRQAAALYGADQLHPDYGKWVALPAEPAATMPGAAWRSRPKRRETQAGTV
jgi:hypothetical protein